MGNVVDHPGFGFQQQPEQPQQSTKPPPASSRIVSSLPSVKVTADDLLEETNKECLICLEEQKIGTYACKLPCGHIFHKVCVSEWLEKQCTCPVCRFELETDDPSYESLRIQKMKTRKLRMRIDELKTKSIGQLRNICRQLDISIQDCIDKQEIIERIQRSNKVIFTESLPPVEISEDELHRKNVSELKHLLLSFGLPTEGALEKSELRGRLLESGRVVVVPSSESGTSTQSSHSTIHQSVNDNSFPNSDQCSGKDYPPIPPNTSTSSTSSSPPSSASSSIPTSSSYTSSSSSSSSYSSPLPAAVPYEKRVSLFKAMSLSQLRGICREYRIATDGCIDKMEVIERILMSSRIESILLAYGTNETDDDNPSHRHDQAASTASASASSTTEQVEEEGRAGSGNVSGPQTASSSITAEDYIDQQDSRMVLSRELIDSLPTEELLMILASCGTPISPSLTREQILTLLQSSPHILVLS